VNYYRHPPNRGAGPTIGIPPMTPMVKTLLIANSAVWIVQFLIFVLVRLDPLSQWLGVVPAAVLQGQIWRPVTYMWLHLATSPFHLLFNMLFLWMLGGQLEQLWGARAFLRYYLVCGIGAGVFIVLGGLIGSPTAITIGASGAVYGLILAFGVVLGERMILFSLIFPMKARTFALIMFFLTFTLSWGHNQDGVSHVAHLGGMIVGYLYLKRAWRVGEFVQELRWRLRRRKFKVMPPKDDDWIH
jgi:membrane associated rhomboid family serine protease